MTRSNICLEIPNNMCLADENKLEAAMEELGIDITDDDWQELDKLRTFRVNVQVICENGGSNKLYEIKRLLKEMKDK